MSRTVSVRCGCGAEVKVPAGEARICPCCGRIHGEGAREPFLPETAAIERDGSRAAPAEGRPSGKSAEAGPVGIGTLVGRSLDHFRILEELGRGGVGTVYRALDTSLDREVALKVLNEEGDSTILAAFVHEARAQARLNHPGIATIFYIGRHGESPYFAMEYVPGKDLEKRVTEGPLPPAEVIRIGLQAVRALREAHSYGITHRDIKPGNFILGRSGTIKLTDFGLAKSERGGLHLTGTSSITGTPFYIAPEQARGESTDFRTDIYSLGAMLYHLAYGRPPFSGESFLAVISKHLSEPLVFPGIPPPDLPVGFTRVIERMMSKDPGGRYLDYDDLERDLRDLLPGAQVVATFFRRAVASALEWAALILIAALAEGVHDVTRTLLDHQDTGRIDLADLAAMAILLVCLALQVLRGKTPGKEFAHIKIASIRGGKPRNVQLVARWFFQWLPALGIAVNLAVRTFRWGSLDWLPLAALAVWIIDGLWALTNRRRRALHDFIAGTWVLEDRPCA